MSSAEPRRMEGADRLVVVLSDIEMGVGGVIDDFRSDAWLVGLLDRYQAPPYAELPVDFVLNGDTFDFLKSPGLRLHPHHVTEGVALHKLGAIAAAHPAFFEALGRIVQHPSAPRRVHFTVGNHDQDLCFPAVCRRIRRIAGLDPDDPRLAFPGFELAIGDIHIEHGSQRDPLFRVDPERQFVQDGVRTLLAVPWGAVALLSTAIPLGQDLCHLDRVKPRERSLEILPEARDLLLKVMWQYWTRDFLRDVLDGHDPLKSVTWPMFREVIYRFRSTDPEVDDIASQLLPRIMDPEGPRLVVLGHLHRASWRSYADRKILVTGALREEYVIDDQGTTVAPMPKIWAEAWLKDDRVIHSQLREELLPLPDGVPASLEELQPVVERLLGPMVHRQESKKEQEQHEEHPRTAALRRLLPRH